MPVSGNHLGYAHYCKHCDAMPIVEGPHHNKLCPRYRPTISVTSDIATTLKCRFCGARPFTPGPHHKDTCRRYQPRVTQ